MSKSFLLFLLTFIAISCKAPEKNIIHLGDDIIYVGVNDHKVDLFEGQYPVKNGISYNSYIVVDTKIMVQVGEVSLVNNKTSLLWDLQNKVFDSTIVLSGTVFFSPKKESKIKENSKDNFTMNYNVEKMIKQNKNEMTSDIRDNNCFCKIFFKLNAYSLIGFDIDKKSLLFYPKISPYIEIKQSLYSNEYILIPNSQ